MRTEFEKNMVIKLRNEGKSFKEIVYIMNVTTNYIYKDCRGLKSIIDCNKVSKTFCPSTCLRHINSAKYDSK